MKLVFLITFLMIGACSTPSKKVTFGPNKATLTEDYANYRFKQIKNVNYVLDFDLTSPDNSYSGKSSILFDVNHLEKNLRLDFHEGEVKSVSVNGQLQKPEYNGTYLTLNSDQLKMGANRVEVSFVHKYSKDGAGFHRFKDPEDQKVYTYTNLEPYKANRVFPCFDQPDLKATYTMKVKAPNNWSVITSVRESQVSKEKGFKTWSFPKSQKFSTYIWSLHAGEYASWSWNKGKYPLRLFVRKSLAKYVKTKDWFPVTDKGFEYFEKYFGVEYPYKKYDQIIVPEFNSGAMENVAAVTFSEYYVDKGVKTRGKRRSLASVILHEMAHMWFGNLVTMKWWNDLWLNESFATYTANLALAAVTEFKGEAWHYFHRTKNWAYWEDQLPTTHPIEAVVPDTQQALANFDGITYGKGAASLKLLHYNIGDTAFQKGLEKYFKTYAVQNTELKDFVGSLEQASGQNLKDWRKKWLQTASVNTVAVDLNCKDGRVSSLGLSQSYIKDHPVLRPHSLQMAMFSLNSEKQPELTSTYKVSFSGKSTTVSQAVGQPCPDIVFPNYGDYGYFKVQMDQRSLKTLVDVLPNVKDSFLRGMYFQALWKMVRDAKLDIYSFSKIFKNNLAKEENELILGNMKYFSESIFYYLPKETAAEKKYFENFVSDLEKTAWSKLKVASASSEAQKNWYSFYSLVARTPWGLKNLEALLAGRQKLKGFTIDPSKRWKIIYQLNRFNYKGAQVLISKELARDKSSSGKKMALKAQAVIPSWDNKLEFLEKMTNKDSKYSFDQFRGLSSSLFPSGQEELRQKYQSQFFEKLKYFDKEKQSQFSRAFARLGPDECLFDSQGQLKNFLKNNSHLKPGTQKVLKVRLSENARCRNIKKLAQEKKSNMKL